MKLIDVLRQKYTDDQITIMLKRSCDTSAEVEIMQKGTKVHKVYDKIKRKMEKKQ